MSNSFPGGSRRRRWKNHVLFLGALALISVALGLALDRFRAHPPAAASVPPGNFSAPAVPGEEAFPSGEPVGGAAVKTIDFSGFQNAVKKKSGLILDARSENAYRQGHVPGARNLSVREFYRDYNRQRSRLESNPGQTILIYCGGEFCGDSEMVARRLIKLGYRNVSVYKDGWADWTQRALPTESGDQANE